MLARSLAVRHHQLDGSDITADEMKFKLDAPGSDDYSAPERAIV